MPATRKILLLFAHPAQEHSEVNIQLFDAAKRMENLTAVDLYGEYPTSQIDVAKEQQRLLDHDVVIFQFPFYWYSTPPILKEWQDLVLEYGFAYGEEGTMLKGKTFLCSLSAGGPERSYGESGINHFSIRDLLKPLEQMALFCQMTYLPPFVIFGSRRAVDEGRVAQHLNHWQQLLSLLAEDKLDLTAVSSLPKINNVLIELSGQ